MKKIFLLIGVGVGYILGAKAGRERYEQIAGQASKVWSDPRVQEKVEDVKAQAPEMKNKMAGAASGVAAQAKSKVTGHESAGQDGSYENETGSIDPTTGETTVDATGFGPGGERLP